LSSTPRRNASLRGLPALSSHCLRANCKARLSGVLAISGTAEPYSNILPSQLQVVAKRLLDVRPGRCRRDRTASQTNRLVVPLAAREIPRHVRSESGKSSQCHHSR
jgi:hypothetical protein